jgi:CRISPR-associated protein Csd2
MPGIYTDPKRRHDFVLLFDVKNGNPNGDPDAGNLPRVDPETMHGLVTDVAMKRKVRDWVDAAHGQEGRNKIYVQHGQYLAQTRQRVFDQLGKGSLRADAVESVMCNEFFDVRMFGAVLPIRGSDSGQVRGPVQLTFATSIDPILPLEAAIVGPAQNAEQSRRTRAPRSAEPDADNGESEEGETRGTMGRKAFVPYGLYRAHGFFVPSFAARTGVTEDDLELLWTAIQNMWDLDRSASRGELALRGLHIFSHDNGLGNAPAHALFDRVQVLPTITGGFDVRPPRSFADYGDRISIARDGLPPGVTLTSLVG